MRATEFIQRCLDAGMPLDMALMASKAFEAEVQIAVEEVLDARRAKDRERQAKHRAKKADGNGDNVTSRDITSKDVNPVSERDLTCERARVRDISPRLVISGSAVAVVERERDSETDWPAGSAKDHAKLLVELAGSPWLDPTKSLDLVTTTGLIAGWKREGASWEHDVKPVVLGLTAKRRARIGSWKFFSGAVAQQIADNRAALAIPEAQVVPLRPGGAFKSREDQNRDGWDYAIARLAQDEQ